MRLFIGCFIRIRGYDALKAAYASAYKGRWIPAGNLHITFRFLGEVDDVSSVVASLEGLEFPRRKRIECKGLEMFGEKILYASCDDPELGRVADAIDMRLAGSFGREKPFIPHVTLMRVQEISEDAGFSMPAPLPDGVTLEGELKVQLIHSESGQRGVYYHVLKEF